MPFVVLLLLVANWMAIAVRIASCFGGARVFVLTPPDVSIEGANGQLMSQCHSGLSHLWRRADALARLAAPYRVK